MRLFTINFSKLAMFGAMLGGAMLGIVGVAGTVNSEEAKQQQLFKKPVDAVQYRQASFSLMGHSVGQMRAMLKGKRPYSQAEFVQRATDLAALASMPWEAFIPGTDMKSMGDKTSALPEIWQKKREFDQLAQVFQTNSAALLQAAQSGDKGQIVAAMRKMGKEGCKGCHNQFKD